MNAPQFPLGSLTAADARWVRQDDVRPAPRWVRSDENRAHLEGLRVSLEAARRVSLREWTRAIIGGLTGAFLFLVVLPVLLVILGA